MNSSARFFPLIVAATVLIGWDCSGVSLGDAVDATNLVWTTGGNAVWFGQTIVTHDGVDAAQSGAIADGQYTSLQTTVTDGPKAVTFWWRASSTTNSDPLDFFIDDDYLESISGESGWQSRTFG